MEYQKGELLYVHTKLGLQEVCFHDTIDVEYVECTYGKYNKIMRIKKTEVSKDPEKARLHFYKTEQIKAFDKIEHAKKRLEDAQADLNALYNLFKDLEMKYPEEFI